MRTVILLLLFNLAMCFSVTGVQATEIISCSTVDSSKNNLSARINLEGDSATIQIDMNGNKFVANSKAVKWGGYTHDRCAARVSGLKFEVGQSNVNEITITTDVFGFPCGSYRNHFATVFGLDNSYIFLKCEGLPHSSD